MQSFCINIITPHIDYKSLYEEQQLVGAALQKTNEEQALQISSLSLQIKELQKFIFGAKQEKFITDSNNNIKQIALFENDKLGEVVVESTKFIAAHEVKKKVVHLTHPGRKPLPDHLRRVEIILEPMEDVSGLKPIGEEVTEILEYLPGELFVKKYIRREYLKPTADNLNKKSVIAPMPTSLPLLKSFVSASLLTHLLVGKYIDHLPIYRQIQIFSRQKVTLEANTVSYWLTQGINLIQALYEAHERLVLQTKYLAVDETTIKVLDKNKKGTTHQGYYWVYYNTISKQVLFKYHPGRGGEWPKETLKGYQGYLQTDGYAGYDQFDGAEGIIAVNCWAHARRKFIDAQSFDNEKASEVLTQIQLLYKVERDCAEKKFEPDKIKDYRQQNSKPILDNLHEILKEQLTKTLPKSPLGVALQYTLARWEKLNVYIIDGNLKIDNNLVENSIRPVALGRKNYLFAGNHDAAQRSAMIYSLFATCKLHDVNPEQWLTYVLENINDHKINKIEELLPQNYAALMKK